MPQFFTDFDRQKASQTLGNILYGADDGEIFLEHTTTESLVLSDRIIKNANYDIDAGFGLRSVKEDASSYACSSNVTLEQLNLAGKIVRNILPQDGDTNIKLPNNQHPMAQEPVRYYHDGSPITEADFKSKADLLLALDQQLRAKDNRIRQVSISLANQYQYVEIIRPDDEICYDIRPLTRLSVTVMVEASGRMEQGSYGFGGREKLYDYISKEQCALACDKALEQALINLESVPAPAGELPVVLGAGWAGVLLHEAVGHGLEGDFNRKKTSVFTDRIGEQVASKGVTVIDDGTLDGRRGSISVDDEGMASARNVLIEDGILKGYLQDRMNARLMNVAPTGNGRRESYEHLPMPRMTNTFMTNGDYSCEEMIASVDDGIYAVNFGGGQVDITSGQFVFSCTEAYKIEKGKVTAPVKGATLIGSGIDVMNKISMVGNDMSLDTGIGTCGKNGQSVPVGVGQPSLKIDRLAIGGTELS